MRQLAARYCNLHHSEINRTSFWSSALHTEGTPAVAATSALRDTLSKELLGGAE